MRNRKEQSLFFLGPTKSGSFFHRCLAMSRELESRGYKSKCVLPSNPISGRVPSFRNYADCWRQIAQAHADVVVLHRSSNFVDYAMIKRIKKMLSTKIIFDYDDAIFHTRLPGRIVFHSHLNQVLSLSDAVTAGSHYLQEFARKFNSNVTLLPSPVDMALFNPSVRRVNDGDSITSGWLGAGTKYQLRYLKILKEPLDVLAQKYDFRLKIVSALSKQVRKEFTNHRFDVDFGLDHWVPIEETPGLVADFDIGVMPLTDDKWSRGKCAMKLLEYMAMKLPTVSSAVGENKYVVDHGHNGFLATGPDEWADLIEKLFVDPNLREDLGEGGYETVRYRYSLQPVVDTLEHVIEELDDTEST